MTANRLRLLSAAFLLMCGGVSFNLIALQPHSEQRAMSAVATGGGEGAADHSAALGADASIRSEAPEPDITVIAVERELRQRGYLDGIEATEGRKELTRAAIFAFEYDHGLPLTATASPELLEALILGRPRAPGSSTKIEARAADLLVRNVQTALMRHGFPVGGIDGQIGPRTRAAIKAFERRENMLPTGRPSAQFLAALMRLDTGTALTTPGTAR